MNPQSGLLGWVAIVGALILAAVLLRGLLRNRGQSAGGVERSEQGAKDLRAQIDRDDDS